MQERWIQRMEEVDVRAPEQLEVGTQGRLSRESWGAVTGYLGVE